MGTGMQMFKSPIWICCILLTICGIYTYFSESKNPDELSWIVISICVGVITGVLGSSLNKEVS